MAEEQCAMNSGHQDLSPMLRCATRCLHWFVWIAMGTYTLWRFATSEVNTSLPQKLSHFEDSTLIQSPYYGVTRYWDISDQEWREGRHFILTTWPWLLLHSVTGRALAHVVPSLVPGYHVAYSLIFVSLKFGWYSAAFFVFEHGVFFALTLIGVPLLCYVVAVVMVAHYDLFGHDFFQIVYDTNGKHAYFVTTVAFYWTVLRGFSFCMDTLRRPADETTAKGWRNCLAHYCKTLAYSVYLPPALPWARAELQ
ncbi:hypothetical protein HPB49_017660 [Dermacentor silvarum]|uniref:Uncharacterized protein n=1 Tax=Dermacentor silvarum TaxID=543639 RepID=A0ACB8CGK9_DERSI|nr:uncharacterized protein LOC119457573 isoform X2 [Dermacentor silvarum]KAH7941806.1 hypothetical protein HPB49_017660 [Dermacentor silvarum]